MKAGERYRIRNTTPGGRAIIEGTATLLRPRWPDRKETCHLAQFWHVRFDSYDDEERGEYLRWVSPEDHIPDHEAMSEQQSRDEAGFEMVEGSDEARQYEKDKGGS